MTVVEIAPAKINLGLRIISEREDGYHNILSIFQTVTLYDELEITSSNKPGLFCTYPSFVVDTLRRTDPEIPSGSENLIIKAEKLFRERVGNLPRVHFTLKKHIPIGGGLAGGSSDAAAALRGLKTFHNVDIPYNVLSEYASLLGSDVSFLIKGGTSVVSGRGEIIVDVEWPFDFTYVLVYPNFAVSTAWAYSSFVVNTLRRTGGNLKKNWNNYNAYQEMTERLAAGTLEVDEFFEEISNDFEKPVFERYSVLDTIKTQLMRNGARRALLTGSGSTVLGIFEDKETASHCAKILKKQNYEIYIVKATTLI